MPSQFLTLGWLACVASLAATSASLAEVHGPSLANPYPFGQAAAPLTSSAPAESPWEFRGVVVDRGKTYVSLFEVATQDSRWVALNEPAGSINVKSYDPIQDVVRIDYQGRSYFVPLKESTIAIFDSFVSGTDKNGPIPKSGPIASTFPLSYTPAAVPPGDKALQLALIMQETRRRHEAGRPSVGPTPVPLLTSSSTRPLLEGR